VREIALTSLVIVSIFATATSGNGIVIVAPSSRNKGGIIIAIIEPTVII
jgi:hypothetical protein